MIVVWREVLSTHVPQLNSMPQRASTDQVAGCDWKLTEEGRSANASDEPHFSTWDDVMGRRRGPGSSASGGASPSAAARGALGDPVDMTYYRRAHRSPYQLNNYVASPGGRTL